MTVKEVQISAMRTFAAERNPELQRVQEELESLKRELAKIEGTSTATAAASPPGSKGKGLANLNLLRNLKYYEIIFEMLARQYELAKIDEAKDTSLIQVLDKAIEPPRKSKPNRTLIVIWSALAALLAAISFAFVREAIVRGSRDPQRAEQLQAFKRYLAWR
jgi:tyrosine-protein kinase Etk/Wzc